MLENLEPCLGGNSVGAFVRNTRKAHKEGRLSKKSLAHNVNWVNKSYGKKYKA